MNKLFGAKKPVEAAPDVNKVGENLNAQVENIDMRIKKIEHDVAASK